MSAYKLTYITDLLDIPEDRLDVCLRELGGLLPIMRGQMEALREAFGPDAVQEVKVKGIEWVDDDAGDLTVGIIINDKPVVTFSAPGFYKPSA